MNTWLLLHYKLPAQPSALRVYAWRKLKRLGAILMNDAVWVLPDSPRTAEHFQWLAVEIQEMQGDVNLWRSNLLLGIQEETLIEQFKRQVDREYKELLKKINKKNTDVAKLSQAYQQVVARDYYHSEIGKQVKEKLLMLRGKAE
jgi:ChrB-like protein